MDDGGGEEVMQVMSEVHLGCPPASSGPHFSNFIVSVPSELVSSVWNFVEEEAEVQKEKQVILDEDGDLVVTRRSEAVPCWSSRDADLRSRCFNVIIKHCIKSSIPAVGLQVWKAELALSDFVLHSIYTSSMFDNIISIELGAGTDCGDNVLDNCYQNVRLNFKTLKYKSNVCVRELDWREYWPPVVDRKCSILPDRYRWTSSEVEEAEDASILLAADVIYSDDLTDALFSTLERLMSRGSEKVLYLALEKRYNFSLDDMDVVANGYSCFLSYVRNEGDTISNHAASQPGFMGKHIDLTKVPQYVLNYNRGEDVEIWEIKYMRARS
ncbi:hypothetical protein MLD38_030188 [Melastoma candidum]|uniref:Uncharacterized protein n=1 Tax=Melastoma candidum TaxID=119954 RepID=A0ACB9MM58_9MYRT|nr:hypothetical protein MLD38_030188 [Melastoma candidum]